MTEPYQPYQPYEYETPQGGAYAPLQPGYGRPYPSAPQEHPQGTTVLVLGVLGLLGVAVCAPFAWYLGGRALRQGRAGGVRFANEQSLVIGRVLGIVGTILLALFVLGCVGFVLVALSAADMIGR